MAKNFCKDCGVELTDSNRSKAYRNKCKQCVADNERRKRNQRIENSKSESNVLWLFGRKVKVVRSDNLCSGCAMESICDRIVGVNESLCEGADVPQKFIEVE